MRIAYVAVEFPTEDNYDHGAGVSMGREVRVLQDHGVDVEVFCWSSKTSIASFFGSPLYAISREFPLPLRWLDRIFWRGLHLPLLCVLMAWRQWRGFRKRHEQEPFDLVMAASSAGIGYFISRFENVPVVTRLSQYQPDWTRLDGPLTIGTWLRDRFEIHALGLANRIWTKSHFMAKVLKKNTGLESNVLEPPFMVEVNNIDYSILTCHNLDNSSYILCLGPLGLRKGTDIIAQAIPRVLDACPETRFVFVGTSREKLKGQHPWQYVQGCLCEDHKSKVIYLGKVSREQMYALITGARAVVIAARTDNLPNASYETMGLGGVLIATENASFDQIVDHGESGFLVPQENPEALGKTIINALNLSDKVRQNISEAAIKRIQEMSPQKAGRRLEIFLQEIVTSVSRGNGGVCG